LLVVLDDVSLFSYGNPIIFSSHIEDCFTKGKNVAIEILSILSPCESVPGNSSKPPGANCD